MNEIWEEIKNVDTSTESIRSFGLMVGGVLIGLAVVLWWTGGREFGTTEISLVGIGGVLVVSGALVPTILRPLYRVWMALAVTMGFIMTRVLLAAVFYGVVTPVGLLRRVFSEDPMCRELDPDASSYWIAKTEHRDRSEKLEKYY